MRSTRTEPKRGPKPNPEARRVRMGTIKPEHAKFLKGLSKKRQREFTDDALELSILIYNEQKEF